MKQQVLSIEQMKHLQELGLDTSNASMCWTNFDNETAVLSVHDEYCYEMSALQSTPTFTLQDILELLPKAIRDTDGLLYEFKMEYSTLHKDWDIGYYYYDIILSYLSEGENILNAAYDMLCWCIENGHVKTNKQKE